MLSNILKHVQNLKKIPYLLKNYLLPCMFCTGARWNIYYQIYHTPRRYRHLSNKTCTKFKKIYFHICWKTIRCHVLFAQELDGIFIVKFIKHQDIIDNYLHRAKTKKKSNIWREKRRGNYQRSSQGGTRFGTSKTAWASAPAPLQQSYIYIYTEQTWLATTHTYIHTHTSINIRLAISVEKSTNRITDDGHGIKKCKGEEDRRRDGMGTTGRWRRV